MKYAYIFSLFLTVITYSQTPEKQIHDFLEREAKNEKFFEEDVAYLKLDSHHFSNSLDAHIYYMQQMHNSTPIYNAIGNFVVKDDKVISFTHNFKSNIAGKANETTASLSPIEAVNKLIEILEIETNNQTTRVISAEDTKHYIVKNLGASEESIQVKLMYIENENQLKLSWDISLYETSTLHWWSARIDANSGELINLNDWMLSCNDDHVAHREPKKQHTTENFSVLTATSTNVGTYNAYPLPVESPNHGARTLISNPSNPASPNGWHDTDGNSGAEYTITRGNNVYAQEDRNGNDGNGYSPNGGPGLNFDFPLDFNTTPASYQDASITNLFVWNNFMHDVWFNYGFDEEAGNFQEYNYEASPIFGNDPVLADAQDGSGLNNANFGTPPDGFSPRMQMFLWSPAGQPDPPLSISYPSTLAGDYNGIPAAFGGEIPVNPINANLALALDDPNSLDVLDACEPLTNNTALNNKIVVIRRGSCTFVNKIEQAQNAGALAVIMVNNVPDNPIVMGGDGFSITIPSIMVSQSDGEAIINALLANNTVSATLVNNGPYEIDGDFDNGIISHEYGHGISTRLTGGKSQPNCLFNEEQMGEGWSDWIALMMTLEPGDLGTDGRGIGTFAVSQPINGNGIRPFKYTTNTTANPSSYSLTNNPGLSVPHGVGFVWSTMLWDLTWAFIDEYGYDNDIYNGNGGNNKIMQLVIDGLKLQTCEPGFIDGRDAILQADLIANNGENQCLIWEVFASRGLGYSATQGDSTNRFDQIEAFDLPPISELNCTLASNTFDNNQLILYPNPATNQFKLNFKNNIDVSRIQVEIYNLNGQLVQQTQLSENKIINISSLKSGIYIVKASNNSVSFTEKLIIE
ncbi:T9SS-dependent M36 family metallopeptidase [Psychroflexus sp. ALD_RP9]|uniref:T9SS-dependent M36 family metallopeptidase n=1 Tax=Psychroflexus sp. ALD_RP9 TaxID=2777186 RepID=UPI001A8D726C|nr:T9SS-dependent M36 family metallopeptidase [Psychroflexus sp. ALD_RP9]QSS96173.1 T9SS-dependent M36 family metallopeptidase [Psychroflexus sp. ALD_RP9]